MVNKSGLFLGRMKRKYGLSELKSSLVCRFKKMGWSRISSIHMVVGNFLLVKCSQALTNWTNKSSLFCFCKFLCLLDLRISICLKRGGPRLEFRIKFNRYSMRFFQRALVVFNNLWIHFSRVWLSVYVYNT